MFSSDKLWWTLANSTEHGGKSDSSNARAIHDCRLNMQGEAITGTALDSLSLLRLGNYGRIFDLCRWKIPTPAVLQASLFVLVTCSLALLDI